VSWRGPTVHQVLERRPSKTPKGRNHDTSSTAASKTGSRANNIGSDISCHHRQPRYDRRGEPIEAHKDVTDVNEKGETGVERSSALGVKQSELIGSFLASSLTASAN